MEKRELESFMPHSSTMMLLDGIVGWSESFESIVCRSTVNEDNPFFEDDLGGVPVIVGFEYMAQTIAALSGLERYLRGDKDPRIGFIIGVRGYKATVDLLPLESEMDIEVNQLLRDGPVVSFDCEIRVENEAIARGTINAYEPDRS